MDNSNNATHAVLSTTDYQQFQILDANRDINRGHVELLKRSIEEHPHLAQAQPVLVNEDMAIIDGQHRFTAAQEMGLPVYFNLVPGLNVSDALTMNITQRGWTLQDYVKHYASLGNREYQLTQTFFETYNDIPVSHVVRVIGVGFHRPYKALREGNFTISERLTDLRKTVEKLIDFELNAPMNVNTSLVQAYLRITNNDNYDHKRFLKKLALHGDKVLRRYASIDDNLRQLEDLYNYANAGNNRVRLY